MITVVSGPPCVGKSTYVREQAEPGDVIVDFDAVAATLGSPVTHGHDPVFLAVATAACRAVIDVVMRGLDRPAWIIDADLHPMRKRIYTEVGARFIALSADPDELHRRADEAGRPEVWHELIDGWWMRRVRGGERQSRRW
jgi:hypothetical protein